MKSISSWVWQWLLIIEACIFTGVYFFSAQGIQAVRSLEQESRLLENEVKQIQIELVMLEDRIAEWKNNDFFIEKHAREQLHMGYEQDEIYILD
jgi:cell division protein FtsB